MSDQGFGRNLQTIFGSDAFRGMGGKPLKSVTLSDDKERITFAFEHGFEAVLGVEGDCCSRSWIEHLTVPDDIAGAEITAVEDQRMERKEDNESYECLQVYQTKFRTPKGDIVLEYRNESNGYYGGYLVRLS